jgi:hypothetical protein
MYGIQTLRRGGKSTRQREIKRRAAKAAKAAADHMKSVGISGLSGTQGAKGQKARFKTEEGRLKKEYKDPNTSDDRKKQIVQDLAGVASDINRLNKVDAINTIYRELGKKGFATSKGKKDPKTGLIVQDIQYGRFGPILSSAGRRLWDKEMDTWSDDRYRFKTGADYAEGSKEQQEEKDLFKKVHPPFFARMAGEFSNLYNRIAPGAILGRAITGEKLPYNRGAFPRNDQFLREANQMGILNPEILKNTFYRGTDEKKYNTLEQLKKAENFVAAYDPTDAKNMEIWRKSNTPVGDLVKEETGMDIFNVEPETTSSRYQENLKKQIDAMKNKTLRENLINQYRSAGGRDVIEDTSFEELWKSPSDRSSYITEERLNEAVQGALDTPPPRVAGEINVDTFGPDDFGVNIFGADDDESFDLAELTEEQKKFMRRPEQSLEYQSKDSLYNKVKALEDKGFLGFGGQEPTTKEEFEEFIQGGMKVADGGYLKQYDDGGYATMSTYEKLKALADSYGNYK